MKNLFILFLLISAFSSNAQRTMFGSQNKYVAPTAVAPPVSSIVTSDLLLYIDAENPNSYGGTGNTCYDLSANLNNGTLSTSTMFNNAATPKKFTFNGTSANNASFVPTKFNTPYIGKTVIVAAKMDANFGTNLFRALFGNPGGTATSRNFNFYVYHNGSGFQLHFSAGDAWLSDVVPLVTGQWYVFAVTQDANSVRFYINGGLVKIINGTAIQQYQSTTNEFLGNADNYWKGDINIALIYKRGLSAAEILQNFNSISTRYGL
jgi:hypothetical protein